MLEHATTSERHHGNTENTSPLHSAVAVTCCVCIYVFARLAIERTAECRTRSSKTTKCVELQTRMCKAVG